MGMDEGDDLATASASSKAGRTSPSSVTEDMPVHSAAGCVSDKGFCFIKCFLRCFEQC